MELNRYIDHTLLKPEATTEQILTLCTEAQDYFFKSVCVNASHVALADKMLRGSGVLVCTVVGFPLGATTTETKAFEAQQAVMNGADEIDMVLNIGALKSGSDRYVEEDIRQVVMAAQGRTVKVILETCLLSDTEIVRACELTQKAGAHFVKTSTGFSKSGATVEHVHLMKKTVGKTMEVKASGGVSNLDVAKQMIAAGATRIGTSSGVALMKGINSHSNY